MCTYESSVKTIPCDKDMVFAVLSDLSNLERLRDRLPKDKVEEMTFDTDSVAFKVPGIGNLGLRIIDREPGKTIKFESENSPVPVNVWIQLVGVSEIDTRLKLTLKGEIPTMVKMMVDKKLKEGIEKIADVLAMVPYGQL